MLVADTTTLVHLVFEGEWHAEAITGYKNDPDWITVPLWRYEFLNVLLKKLRAGHFGAEAAAVSFRQAAERMIPMERTADDLQAIEIATRHRISAYDACYVALAQQLKVPLLTEDRELLTKFPEFALTLKSYAANLGN
jgi:predicted nucleic acid-binding protein